MNRIILNLGLLIVTFFLTGCLKIEERFHHDHLGGDLKIDSVEFCNSKGSLFKFRKDEILKLQQELGRLLWFDLSIEDCNGFDHIDADLIFVFSDGVKVNTSARIGTAQIGKEKDVFIFEIDLPDDPAFQGVIPVYVRLSHVVNDKRLQEMLALAKKN